MGMPLAIACTLLVLLTAQAGQGADPRDSLVINEILASNSLVIRDPQGQYEDWIELYNPAGTAVDVAGLYLTDDLSAPTRWQIPAGNPAATTLPAHGYLLIWADGDTASPGLHAGFKLKDGGEEVGLFRSDGVTLIDGWVFGQQVPNVSYGRYPDGGPDLQFMTACTPGRANKAGYAGLAQEPRIEPSGGLCSGPVMVTIRTPTAGADIYYTLDGTEPYSEARQRPFGLLYSGPIPIARATTLKAVAWRPGWLHSPVAVQRYLFLASEIQGFSSPLPIAVVDTMGQQIARPQTLCWGLFFEPGDQGRTTVLSEPTSSGRAGINIRGKSSESFPKHQYHFETWDDGNRDRPVSILGFPPGSDWVLQGPYTDKSLMRNFLAYQLSNDMGQYAVRTRFIELFLNTDNGPIGLEDYAGVYVFMEKIKISPDRVNITHVQRDAGSPAPITGGFIIKKDKFDPEDQSFVTTRGQILIYTDPNGSDLTQQEKDWIKSFFNSFEAALYGSKFSDPVNGYARFIDVDSFIDHHILVELAKNIDGFRLSTYMFIDNNGKLHMGPVWDYDLSFGNANYNDGWNSTGWYNRLLSDTDYPYWRRLFQDKAFRSRYANRWSDLRRDLFSTERLLGTIDDHASLIDEPAARNFRRWPILGTYVWPNWFIANTFQEEIAWMKGWLSDRLSWMDGQIASEFGPAAAGLAEQGQ
jgi:hypothetical protein